MSSFIANTIQFNPGFTAYRMKGGDNNVYPRPDYWTKEIPIGELIHDLDGRTTQLTNTPKHRRINAILNKYQQQFEERIKLETPWGAKKGIWYMPDMIRKNEVTAEDIEFFKALEAAFIQDLKDNFRTTAAEQTNTPALCLF